MRAKETAAFVWNGLRKNTLHIRRRMDATSHISRHTNTNASVVRTQAKLDEVRRSYRFLINNKLVQRPCIRSSYALYIADQHTRTHIQASARTQRALSKFTEYECQPLSIGSHLVFESRGRLTCSLLLSGINKIFHLVLAISKFTLRTPPKQKETQKRKTLFI